MHRLIPDEFFLLVLLRSKSFYPILRKWRIDYNRQNGSFASARGEGSICIKFRKIKILRKYGKGKTVEKNRQLRCNEPLLTIYEDLLRHTYGAVLVAWLFPCQTALLLYQRLGHPETKGFLQTGRPSRSSPIHRKPELQQHPR